MNYVLQAEPGPRRLHRAHEVMQRHIPTVSNPHRCRCGDPFPCLTRFYARYCLILAGHLVIDRRPPQGT